MIDEPDEPLGVTGDGVAILNPGDGDNFTLAEAAAAVRSAKLVGLDGKPIEGEPPHIAECTEILRSVADKLENPEFYSGTPADRVLIIVGFEDGAQYLAFNKGLTLAETLWMLERERHGLLERAGRTD